MKTKQNIAKWSWLLLSGSMFLESAYADVRPNSLFSDHAVLQQGIDIPVWGTADDGENVTVEFNGQKVSTVTKDGKWMVRLKAQEAGGPYVLTCTGANVVEVKDIFVGEVWVCSGQSNMERQLGPRPPQRELENWREERENARYPQIREYRVDRKYSTTPVSDAESKWVVCSPQTVSDFSAIGYFFARDLHKERKVPVGMIFSAYGGTKAEYWTSQAVLAGIPELMPLVRDYDKAVEEGQKVRYPSGLYYAMVAPLQPYAIKGVIWYQGESDCGQAGQYRTLFPAMIEGWRKDWKQGDFPFLYVQIAPYKDSDPELREAQLQTLSRVKRTAMVVTTDVGDAEDIHPVRKSPVGFRLCKAAQALAYGEDVVYSGPLFRKMRVKGSKAVLSFKHTGEGLVSTGGELKGFEISDDDVCFYPAQAYIEKNKVIVYSEQVESPVSVRYGWSNVPDVNLYNKDGFPASPFRVDKNSMK